MQRRLKQLRDWAKRTYQRVRHPKQTPRQAWSALGPHQLFVVIAMVAIAITQLTLLGAPAVGIYLNALLLAGFVGVALRIAPLRQVGIALAILPTANLVVLSLPPASPFAQAIVWYDVILLLTLIYRYLFAIDYPITKTRMKLIGYIRDLPIMIILGQLLGLIGYALLHSHYPFHGVSTALVAATAIVFAVAEEALFRGLIQQRASLVMRPELAAGLAAIIYALFAIGTLTVWAPIFALLLGATCSYVYYRKPNLMLTVSINATAKLLYLGLLATFILK